MEMSLVYDSLVKAFVRERALLGYRRKNLNVLAVNPKNLDNPKYEVLRTALGQLAGTIHGSAFGGRKQSISAWNFD